MPQLQEVGLFGKPIREYVDAAEWPAVSLMFAVALAYIGSYWLTVSYLNLMAPLTLMLQVLASVATSYLNGVRGGFSFGQTAVVCCLVGIAGGLVGALFALIRFWYPWLALNLAAEPVWGGLLGAFVGILTLGFFRLPEWLSQWRGQTGG